MYLSLIIIAITFIIIANFESKLRVDQTTGHVVPSTFIDIDTFDADQAIDNALYSIEEATK